jgi:hypothetical protein
VNSQTFCPLPSDALPNMALLSLNEHQAKGNNLGTQITLYGFINSFRSGNDNED